MTEREFTADAASAWALAGVAIGLALATLVDLAAGGPGLLVVFGFAS